jgi:hypothetical protein
MNERGIIMGFLSRLNRKKKNATYVRTWVHAWAKQNINVRTPQDLFAGMIYSLESFGENPLTLR